MFKKLLDKYWRFREGSTFKSFCLAFSQGLVALAFILLDFFFSKKITVEEFGVYKQVFFVIGLLVPMLALGIPEGYKYYLAKDGRSNSVFSTAIMFLFLIAAALALATIGLNFMHYLGWISIQHYYLVSLLFPFAYLSFVLNKTLRYNYINDDRVILHTKVTTFFLLLSNAFIAASYFYLPWTKDYYLFVAVGLYIAVFGLPIYTLIKKMQLRIGVKWVDKKYIGKMLHQGIPLYMATFIGLATINLGKAIVTMFEDDKAFAIFSVGALEIPVFAMLSAAFSQNIYPVLVRLINSNEPEKAKTLWLQTTKKVSFITYPLVLVLMLFSREIIFFIYNAEYNDAVVLFQTFLLISLFRNNYYGAILAASGKTKYITLYSVLVLVLNAVLSISLYYVYGIKGVVYGNLFSTALISVLQLNHEKMLGQYVKEFLLDYRILILIIAIIGVYFVKVLNT